MQQSARRRDTAPRSPSAGCRAAAAFAATLVGGDDAALLPAFWAPVRTRGRRALASRPACRPRARARRTDPPAREPRARARAPLRALALAWLALSWRDARTGSPSSPGRCWRRSACSRSCRSPCSWSGARSAAAAQALAAVGARRPRRRARGAELPFGQGAPERSASPGARAPSTQRRARSALSRPASCSAPLALAAVAVGDPVRARAVADRGPRRGRARGSRCSPRRPRRRCRWSSPSGSPALGLGLEPSIRARARGEHSRP